MNADESIVFNAYFCCDKVYCIMMKRWSLYIIMCLATLFVAPKSVAQIDTGRVMNIARNALQFEDYVLSIQYFNQIIKLKPYWADPYYYRSVAKLNLDDLQGALDDATACIERNPYFENVFYLRGVIRQNMGDYSGAIADYKQGLEFAPGNRNLLNNIAIANVQREAYAAADTAYAALLERYPSYADGYIMRGQLSLLRGDTLAAFDDLDRAISLNSNLADAYAMRSVLQVKYRGDNVAAIEDMNRAVKLSPRNVDYYINRALMRYNADDLRGAMSDYDYVLIIDPTNVTTYYNRGLLRVRVGDYNRAVDDFNQVIKREPYNYLAIYNRAITYDIIGEYEQAIADYDKIIEVYPEYLEVLFARSESKRKMGDMKGGQRDFDRAVSLQEKRRNNPQYAIEASNRAEENIDKKISENQLSEYDKLIVADDDLAQAFEPKYESEVRGRIQDKGVMVSLQPIVVLSYYERPNELRPSNFFADELDYLNEQNAFAHNLLLTNEESMLEAAQITEHFASAGEYTRLIDSEEAGRTLRYMGRAIDLMLLQEYTGALEDLDRVVALSPNFMLAYFQRANVRYKHIEYKRSEATFTPAKEDKAVGAAIAVDTEKLQYEKVIDDLDRCIALSPRFVYAYYNRGNIYFAIDEVDKAIADYTEVIRQQPDMADAYFNRGLAYIKKGMVSEGRADLSRAGEMGIMAAYNILKRMDE